MNLTAIQRNQKCLQQLSSHTINEPHVPLSRGRKTGSVFCICHISSSPWWPQCVSNALAHKGQIDTKEPGEWEHCGKWLPCGHFEHARPSFHMCCLLLSLSKGDLSPPLSPNKDHRAALTSYPIWWLLKILCGTFKPLKNTKNTFL